MPCAPSPSHHFYRWYKPFSIPNWVVYDIVLPCFTHIRTIWIHLDKINDLKNVAGRWRYTEIWAFYSFQCVFFPWSQEQLIGLSEAKMEEEFGKHFENGDLSHLIWLSHDFLKPDH